MVELTQVALISPRDGFAGSLSQDRTTVTLCVPEILSGGIISVGNYASRFPDTTVVECNGSSDIIEQLDMFEDKSLALDFTLLLLDPSLSNETRRDVAIELGELLAVELYRDYVLDIMLASPMSDEVNFEQAKAAARDLDAVLRLLDTLAQCQDRVRKACEAWLSMRDDPMVQNFGIRNVQGIFIHFGVFRRLVEEAKTRSEADSFKGQLAISLLKQCDARIVTRFVTAYAALLPMGTRSLFRNSDLETENETEEPFRRNSVSRQPREGADIKRERAESQVDRIADEYVHGNHQNADQYLEQLIESQTHNTADHIHVVKSLCNIAKKCALGGDRKSSFKCLMRALNFPSGIDTVLYLQIGNSLRDVSQYDEALDCYEKARQLDIDFKWHDEIHLEMIRIAVAKGDYEAALTQYLQIPDIRDQPSVLTSLGTLYRRMGNLHEARQCYSNVLTVDDRNHAAHAGLAEANKQSGRYHKAIRRYNKIVTEFVDIEEGSLKIYSLGRSILFRLTSQFKSAERLLSGLALKHPKDCDVHFQQAKLYRLMGDIEKSDFHFQNARDLSLNSVATELFLAAMGNPVSELLNPDRQLLAPNRILPDDQGLVNCRQALAALEMEDLSSANTILARTHFIDRVQADFGAVLGYHGKKMLDRNFDFKSDTSISRIAKRGYGVLQHTVHAIAEGDFHSANVLERRMFLLLA